MEVSEQIRSAGARYFGVDPESFKSLEGQDGAVYACRRGNLGYVIKFVPTAEEKIPAIVERFDFIQYLASRGVPVAVPLESLANRRYERLEMENTLYLVTLTTLADGRHPQARNLYDWNERLFNHWGQVIGQMHAASRLYPKWQKPDQDAPAHYDTALADWREEHQDFVDWCKEPKILEKWMPFRAFFASLPQDRSNFGLIHNDLHPFNFFYNPDARDVHPLVVIDFDVCSYHWFINDIAIALYHAVTSGPIKTLADRQSFARHFLFHFLDGYRKENDLDESWFEHLPALLKYREILLYIALTNSWPESQRNPWQKRFLAEKRKRTLRDEPIL